MLFAEDESEDAMDAENDENEESDIDIEIHEEIDVPDSDEAIGDDSETDEEDQVKKIVSIIIACIMVDFNHL